MAATCWANKNFRSFDKFYALHNCRVFADAFGQKRPLMFCANEDCAYFAQKYCPAGAAKKNCPNKSKLDHDNGCTHYIGKQYQYSAIQKSLEGIKPIHVTITGRGTGKTGVILTNKSLMECTTEPYIRMMMYKCSTPVRTMLIVVGNTKDTALVIRNSIVNSLESNDLLRSMTEVITKTYVRFKNGSEMFFKTAGSDGRSLRGFHAALMKNIKGKFVKTTIWFLIDEGCFLRAKRIINEVVLPSLQIGNTFSGMFITSTPWSTSGEVYDIWTNDSRVICKHHFASHNNPFTNLELLLNFRDRMQKAGMGSLFNREALGLFESDQGLFWPYDVWMMSIDDSLDWMSYDDIKKLEGKKIPGQYYLGIDPNKFRQLEAGDFAAYLLISVSGEREHVRAISYGKYLMDLEDDFLDRMELINSIFNPTIICDQNSGYLSKLKNMGMDVRPGKNDTNTLLLSMAVAKLDFIHGIYKQPSSLDWEDERRSFIPKDVEGSSQQRLDHKGDWGGGFTSDLLSCLSYSYQGIMEDYDINMESIAPRSTSGIIIPDQETIQFVSSGGHWDRILRSSNGRFERMRKI
jgi:hypothetical protein